MKAGRGALVPSVASDEFPVELSDDGGVVSESVRPIWKERKKEDEMRCHVCGVDDDEEEMSDGGEESDGGGEKKAGEVVERFKATKDERKLKEVTDPRRPSPKEVEEHRRTHLPYRNWCEICVRAKGKDMDHRKDAGKERGMSEYSFDYCFPGDELGFKVTVLAGRERATGMYSATTVPMKGSTGQFAIDKIMETIDEVGDTGQTIIMKTDQEPSVVNLVEDVVKAREEGRTIVEESPVGSSGSNGVVERAAQSIEGQIRVILLALEERIGRQANPQEAVATFMPEYAAYLLNRLEVGKDGKTAYERAKGKVATVVGLEFGEKLLWRKKKGDKMAKIRSRWAYGVFLGVRWKSGEMWVASKTGEVFKVRAAKRIPEENRWSEDCANWVKYTPWNKYKDDPDADGEIPEEKAVGPEQREKQAVVEGSEELMEKRYVAPRAFKISRADAEKHGYTRGCAGCSSWFRGMARQAHTTACRKRFQEAMKTEAKVLRSKEQEEEFKRRIEAKKGQTQEERAAKEDGPRGEPDAEDDDDRMEDEEVFERRGPDREGEGEGGSSGSGLIREREGGDEEGGGKRAIIAGLEARKALEKIEVWIEGARVSWANEEAQEDRMLEEAWDDVKGGALKVEDVKGARKEEVGYMVKRRVWVEVPVGDCWRRTGKAPISTRWVDTNKGSEEAPDVRCRLVARDFKGKESGGREELFAATPPTEAERLALSRAATVKRDKRGLRVARKVMFIDAKKAHLNPLCEEDVYIELPEEAGAGPGVCGKLVHWLYGCRPAAQAWENFYAEKLESVGFVRGDACGVVFYSKGRDMTCVCHGDDFTVVGEDGGLRWLAEEMGRWFEIKVRAVLGPEARDDKEVIILGRVVRWKEWGIEFQADPRHRKVLAEYFGFDEKSGASAFNGDRERKEEPEDEEEMDKKEATEFRGLAARLNYLAQDSPDLQYPAKEVSREMARPTKGAWRRLKKVVRYLLGREAVVWWYEWQEGGSGIRIWADSDWGGSRWDRRSTSGGVLKLGKHCIKTWSSTQGAVALSSAEAEFYAMVDAVQKGKWMSTVATEMGIENMGGADRAGHGQLGGEGFCVAAGAG